MKKALAITLALFGTTLGSAADLPRSLPEVQGVNSAGIQSFIDTANEKVDSLHSIMIVRHGHVIAEGWWAPYRAETPHQLYSLSKSFTSTAIGLAIAEGKLKLDDPVLKFFPKDAPANPSANLKSMRLSDLLRMSTGQQAEPPRKNDEAWTKTFLSQPVPFKPGTHFLYNTSATYMLSAALQEATGQNLLDYLTPRLFEPLGIRKPTWEMSPQGVATGGYGLNIRTEDIAKFGQLYLQKGKWNGKQIVPEAWVAAATARQTSNGSSPTSDWDQGYGYQFWRCRHNAYRGDGAFGQYCIVLPEQDAVIAITSGVKDMQAVLNLCWDHLLPAMKTSPLPENPAANRKLNETMKSLMLKIPTSTAAAMNVKGQSFAFPSNAMKLESLKLETDTAKKITKMTTRWNGREQTIECGEGAWAFQKASWAAYTEQPLAACGAWTASDTYTAKICFVETPFVITAKFKFDTGTVEFQSETNVSFGSTKPAVLVGQVK